MCEKKKLCASLLPQKGIPHAENTLHHPQAGSYLIGLSFQSRRFQTI